MSAFAFYVTENKIHLCGDGIWMRGDEVLSKGLPKACKLSPQVALLSVGAGIPMIQGFGHAAIDSGFTEPKYIADFIAASIKNAIGNDEEQDLKSSFLTLVIGYNAKGTPVMYQVNTVAGEKNDYTPVKFDLKPSTANAIAQDTGPELTSFRDHLKTNLLDDMNEAEAVKKAFSDMLLELRAAGKDVTEHMFYQTISGPTPPG